QQLRFVNFNPEDRVVDFACGNGLLLDLIHGRVKAYVGVDFSSEFIAEAEARQKAKGISNGTFHCEDIIRFCETHPGEFDLAFASDFSEHIYDEDFIRIFSMMRIALKPKGRLYVHTPNGAFFLERLKNSGVLKQLEEHVAVRDEPEMCRLLQESGYRILNRHHLPHYRWILAALHPLSWIPGLKGLFSARLLFECEQEARP
ncbi:MAG: class I SAM-dependent methyltransferase, partial [Candidatus Omnitrophica bacterium]|nr:class I SAM-dependent methyltransferase [Candidatus Omnitrophota bacterium]